MPDALEKHLEAMRRETSITLTGEDWQYVQYALREEIARLRAAANRCKYQSTRENRLRLASTLAQVHARIAEARQ